MEDNEHRLAGVISFRSLLQLLQDNETDVDRSSIPVSRIMDTDVPTVAPGTATLDAIKQMQDADASCLPVVEDGRLVGIVTEYDFIRITAQLLEDKLPE